MMETTNLPINNVDIPQWYVMRVYKREKDAEAILNGVHGLKHFIAKSYQVRTYNGVKRKVLAPAIPSIVFVHASRKEIREFKTYCPYLQYCYWRMKDSKSNVEEPLVVPNAQMENFIKIASQYDEDIKYYNPDEISLNKGTRVRVHGGLFDGLEGTLLKLKDKRSKRIVVRLDGVAAIAASQISPDLIELL